MSNYILKYLQPAQYDSWLKKVDDPDWYEDRYRDASDRAMTSAIRELRDVLSQRAELLEALKLYVDHFGDPLKVARPAIAKAEGL